MEIVLSLVILGLVAYIIYDKKSKKTVCETIKPKKETKKLTKEEKEKQEKIKTSFENLMQYDYTTALRGDK